jgi:hypothetical protein
MVEIRDRNKVPSNQRSYSLRILPKLHICTKDPFRLTTVYRSSACSSSRFNMYKLLFLIQLLFFITSAGSASIFPKHFNLFERIAPTTPTLEIANTKEIQSRQAGADAVEEWIAMCEALYDREVVANGKTFQRECGVMHIGHDTRPFPSFSEETECLEVCALSDPTEAPCVGFSMKLDVLQDGSTSTSGDCYLKDYIRPPRPGLKTKYFPWISYKVTSG